MENLITDKGSTIAESRVSGHHMDALIFKNDTFCEELLKMSIFKPIIIILSPQTEYLVNTFTGIERK